MMMTIVSLGFAISILALHAWADVVELKTGQRVEGTFRGADEASVRIEVGGQVITFKTEQVRAMYFGAPPASASVAELASGEALRALKALQSAASAGVTYRDYAPRVIDTKIQVDRYLAGNAQAPERAHVLAAMGYYELASQAWNYASTDPLGGFVSIGKRVEVERANCPSLQTLVDQGVSRAARLGWKAEEDRLRSIGIMTASGLPLVWACASNKITEAEKLIGR